MAKYEEVSESVIGMTNADGERVCIGLVRARQLTKWATVLDCARETAGKASTGNEPSSEWKTRMLISEHSPIRALMFQIELCGIPSWVSVHFVRHKYGVEHYVQSQRNDRRTDGVDRNSQPQNAPVNHLMIVNAAEVLFMARKRLCAKASPETRAVMVAIVRALRFCGAVELANLCQPDCAYRGGFCPELQPCGACPSIWESVKGKAAQND